MAMVLVANRSGGTFEGKNAEGKPGFLSHGTCGFFENTTYDIIEMDNVQTS